MKMDGIPTISVNDVPPKPKDNSFTEEQLVRTSSEICMYNDGHIVLIGGQITLPSISGGKKYRSRSSELDFVVDDEGIESIEDMSFLKELDCFAFFREGIPCAAFYDNIKGLSTEFVLDDIVKKETEYGTINHVSPERAVVMKFRRGAMKGHFYGKDALDYYSLAVAAGKNSPEINNDAIAAGVREHACPSCKIGKKYGCIDMFIKTSDSVPPDERAYALRKAEELGGKLGCVNY
jgi:hypothetical protein